MMKFLKRAAPIAAVALFSFVGVKDASAASLVGSSIFGCTDSVFSGSVTTDTASCDSNPTSFESTETVVDPGIEWTLGGANRAIDIGIDTISIIYTNFSSSPSADLFIFTGFSGITGLTLLTSNDLNVTTAFTSGAIGLLVNDPHCCTSSTATVTYRIEMTPQVPLPAGLMLLPTALAGLGFLRRRKQS